MTSKFCVLLEELLSESPLGDEIAKDIYKELLKRKLENWAKYTLRQKADKREITIESSSNLSSSGSIYMQVEFDGEVFLQCFKLIQNGRKMRSIKIFLNKTECIIKNNVSKEEIFKLVKQHTELYYPKVAKVFLMNGPTAIKLIQIESVKFSLKLELSIDYLMSMT